jgi:hypothetical protein
MLESAVCRLFDTTCVDTEGIDRLPRRLPRAGGQRLFDDLGVYLDEHAPNLDTPCLALDHHTADGCCLSVALGAKRRGAFRCDATTGHDQVVHLRTTSQGKILRALRIQRPFILYAV